ncbi:HAD family hydrolase [Hoeflea prorocentri]|uniref:HAD family phosphatase n=1 Tax=Hoeflea prorocentri TaxID=1922333 RepID=A0A9X3ZIS1_9HYPH|nr:HAD family phosphatase [Hoeflea prorocentri]MCY6382020.1 HAD family phosphatase [Hoeflea prorocentri]MDA5399820.1 HAD family phosphatase [Hoeflea prorocentri]
MKFAAIIFDCDGVLVDSEVIYTAVERQHLERIGLSYDASEYQRRFMGLSSADYLAELDRDHRSEKGRALPEDFGTSLRKACIARMKTDLRMIDGIDAVIHRFDGPMAVASSSAPDSLVLKLELTRLRRHFDPHIYHAGQVDNGKPAPDLFLMAAGKLDADPAGCLVIEDSVNGVKAGLAAGMTVWGFAGGGHVGDDHAQRLEEAGAHAVFSDHQQVRARL